MMEIVADLAPGASLFFATANGGPAQMATNIQALQAAGCNVIVDDVTYFNESPFQDGRISQAVNAVSALGVLYFSSARNSGNLNDGASGTWEGDFADGGAVGPPLPGAGRLHNFGGATFDTVTGGTRRRVDLFWADPLGGSGNDYDVFVLNAAGTAVLASSTNSQTGTQNPFQRGRYRRRQLVPQPVRRWCRQPGRDLQLGRSAPHLLHPGWSPDHPRELLVHRRDGPAEAGHHRRGRGHLLGSDPGLQSLLRNIGGGAPRRCHRRAAPVVHSDAHRGTGAERAPPSVSVFPKGATPVSCTVEDATDNTASCSFQVTVNDTEGPRVLCSVATPLLWPPNHNLVNVGLAATAVDNCAGPLPIAVSVRGDENDEMATGDGRFSPDARSIAVGALRLRSERRGDANGRVYLDIESTVDGSGNAGWACCTVVVPHDRSARSIASVMAQAASAQAFCAANGVAPPEYFVIGDGPIMKRKQ